MRVLFFSLLLLPASIWGQQQVPVARLLASALSQKEVLRQNEKTDFLKSSSFSLPWINEVEVRVRTNEFDFDLNRYTVRAKPNTPLQRNYQHAYQKSVIAVNESQNDILLNNAFKLRYQLIADWYYTKQMLTEKGKLKILYLDRINALKNSIAYQNFDINDLIKAENDLNDLERSTFLLKENIRQFQIKATDFTAMKNISDIIIDNFISIETLKKNYTRILRTKIKNHPLVKYYDEKVNLATREYKLKKANATNFIDYVEARYENKKKDYFNEHFAVGVGITIPTKGSNELMFNKLKLKKISEEIKLRNQKDALQLQKKLLRSHFESLLREYDLIHTQISHSSAAKTIEEYEKYGDVSAFTLLDIQEGIYKKSEEIVKIKYQILLAYIELLDVYGKFTERPLRNYFSNNMEELR